MCDIYISDYIIVLTNILMLYIAFKILNGLINLNVFTAELPC